MIEVMQQPNMKLRLILMVINLVHEQEFYANGAVELPANEIDNFGLKDILVLNTNCRV